MTDVDGRLRELCFRARAEGRDVLLEHELLALLPALGLLAPRHVFVPERAGEDAIANACGALTSERVVLKVQAVEVVHKNAAGGVVFVEREPDALRAAVAAMRERFAKTDVTGYLVCEEIPHAKTLGSERLLGMRHTRDFGPVVAIGPGGVDAEALAEQLGERAVSLLCAASPTPTDTAVEHQLLETWLRAAERWCPTLLAELEVNPVIGGGSATYALDAFARLGAPSESATARPAARMANLLTPSSIAVIGVSDKPNPGHIILRNLLADGFDGSRIWIVKPGREVVMGCAAVPTVAALPEPVDLLVVAIAAGGVCDVVEEAITAGRARSMIIVPGGMGEHAAGRAIDVRLRELIDTARRADPDGAPVINGGNCLGIRSRPGRYDTMFVPRPKMPALDRESPLALISGSGALLVSLASKLAPMSPRYSISLGNQIDVTLGDHLDYLAGDGEVSVFACYVEGFAPLDGRRWLEAAQRITASGRLVVLYRAARTTEGTLASASHTAALATDARVSRELARRAGVLVADTLDDFADLTRLGCLLEGRHIGPRVGALSNAGFECVAFADRAAPLELAPLGTKTRQRLDETFRRAGLADIVTVRNPLDVNPMLGDADFVEATSAILDDDEIDVAVVGCIPMTAALHTLPEERSEASVVDGLVDVWRRTRKAWVVVVAAGATYDPMASALEAGGIPVFRSADRAMRLLSAYVTRDPVGANR